jgi:hypothetical protein
MSRDYSIQWPARRQLVKECAFSRLGLDVGRQARQSMIRRVRKGDVKYARKLTNSRTVIVLDDEGREWAFLYSSATKEIICFLGPDAPEIADWVSGQAAADTEFETEALTRGSRTAPLPLVHPVWFRLHGTPRLKTARR